MVWLWENFKEKNNWDELEPEDRKTTCTIYFLDEQVLSLAPETDDRWNNYIKPMMKLRDLFVAYVRLQQSDFKIWDMNTDDEYFTKFGVMATGKGASTAIMMDNLAGVATTFVFSVRKPPVDWKHSSVN